MKIYTIEEGNHYCNGINVKFHSNVRALHFETNLNSNCLYTLGTVDDFDINKIYGITWGLLNDKNSFRIGWNCQNANGMIQYHAYLHDRGVMRYKYLFESLPGSTEIFGVVFERGSNEIQIFSSGGITTIPFDFTGIVNYGYYNWPYFGGNSTAPHYMTMGIRR